MLNGSQGDLIRDEQQFHLPGVWRNCCSWCWVADVRQVNRCCGQNPSLSRSFSSVFLDLFIPLSSALKSVLCYLSRWVSSWSVHQFVFLSIQAVLITSLLFQVIKEVQPFFSSQFSSRFTLLTNYRHSKTACLSVCLCSSVVCVNVCVSHKQKHTVCMKCLWAMRADWNTEIFVYADEINHVANEYFTVDYDVLYKVNDGHKYLVSIIHNNSLLFLSVFLAQIHRYVEGQVESFSQMLSLMIQSS